MCSVRERADRAHSDFCSSRAELLSAIAEVLRTNAWHGDGASDASSWVAARWQMSARTARELVRDAQALAARPALSSALATGSISVDQSKALAVLCRENTDDDELCLESLPFWSFSELEREARKQTARELERKDGGTYLRMQHTRDERFLRGEFQLHPEDGATLIAAIDARIPTGTSLRDYDTASALALVELAKGSATAAQQRPTVLVGEEVGELSSGGLVGVATAERLACDANLQAPDATRTTAAVPAATRRAVEARDGGPVHLPGLCQEGVPGVSSHRASRERRIECDREPTARVLDAPHADP